jgi:hypothetical protein
LDRVIAVKLVALLLAACVTQAEQGNGLTVTESLAFPRSADWASAEGSVIKLEHIRNVRHWAQLCDLICDGEHEAQVLVPADDFVSMYVSVPARYQVGEACFCL